MHILRILINGVEKEISHFYGMHTIRSPPELNSNQPILTWHRVILDH